VLTLAEWAARDLPPADFLLGEFISTTMRMLLAADTGLGKTMWMMALGMRAAAGVGYLHWPGQRPSRVLYIDGEMSRRLFKQRLADEAARLGVPPPETFFALSSEDVPAMEPLNTHKGQMNIQAIIEQRCGGAIDLIVFDNIMALIAGEHKEEEGWGQTVPWTRHLTRRAIGQAWVHHTGHDTTHQYGTKTREWQMDTYAHLEKVERPDTDVSFLLHFKKARERTPDNREQFADTHIALVGNQWTHDAGAAVRQQGDLWKSTKALRALRKALTSAVSKHGFDYQSEGATVRAVEMQQLREEFKTVYVASSDADPAKRRKALEAALRRALSDALPHRLVVVGEKSSGEQIVWGVEQEM
jgi:hypothetical protein